jgi:hypothetical protein
VRCAGWRLAHRLRGPHLCHRAQQRPHVSVLRVLAGWSHRVTPRHTASHRVTPRHTACSGQPAGSARTHHVTPSPSHHRITRHTGCPMSHLSGPSTCWESFCMVASPPPPLQQQRQRQRVQLDRRQQQARARAAAPVAAPLPRTRQQLGDQRGRTYRARSTRAAAARAPSPPLGAAQAGVRLRARARLAHASMQAWGAAVRQRERKSLIVCGCVVAAACRGPGMGPGACACARSGACSALSSVLTRRVRLHRVLCYPAVHSPMQRKSPDWPLFTRTPQPLQTS